MEKVTAFMAFNGRLFPTEDKCIAYEEKYAKYPIVKKKELHAADRYTSQQGHVEVPIIKYITETQKKPGSRKETEFYYIIDGKYRFTPLLSSSWMDNNLMNGYVFYKECRATNWFNIGRYLAEEILTGTELTDDILKRCVEFVNDSSRPHNYPKDKVYYTDYEVSVIESGIKWEINNKGWESGKMAPLCFTIEKLF